MRRGRLGLIFVCLLCCCNILVQSGNLKGKKVEIPAGFRVARNNGVYVIAHRGAHNGIPENSLAAYQKAIDLGCDFVEIDVRTTRDGKFVSIHNSAIDEYVAGKTGKVKDLTLAELKTLDIGLQVGPEWKNTRIPTFDEIVQLCNGKIGIYIDLKDAPVPELMKILKNYNMEHDVVWYFPASRIPETENIDQMFAKTFPMPDPGAAKNIRNVTARMNISVIATDMGQLSKRFVHTAHKYNALVFVDEKSGTKPEWNQILKWKTDGIQTDNPEELIGFLQKKK